MAKVPDNILNWLYTVLQNGYQDANGTFGHVAKTLANYPSLRPRTEVYTSESGSSDLLLQLHGTLPVQFRDEIYRFPITIWLPQSYPREGPIVFVVPSQGMMIRPGQHVYNNGRVFHPYLAQWAKFWDKSSLDDFLGVLRGVFAKDPPVMSSQPFQAIQQQAVVSVPPPPPREYVISPQSAIRSLPVPTDRPPLPPKLGAASSSTHSSQLEGSGPPLPPLPTNFMKSAVQGSSFQQIPYKQSPVSQQYVSNQRHSMVGPGTAHMAEYQPRPQEFDSPVSPIQPQVQHQQFPTFQPPPNQPISSYQPQPNPQGHRYSHGSHPSQIIHQNQQHFVKKSAPPIDLLTSPLEVTIPSQIGNLEPLPAPPIPPNPQKDALLEAVSAALIAETTRSLEFNKNAVPSLLAQQAALRNAYNTLQAEIDQVHHLGSTLDNNERVLRLAMQEADQVMRDAAGRAKPEVDDVLVCPTVVGSQLYMLVAEQKACEAARVGLVRGLDRGRVGADVFVKQTRSLAREEFLKKALIRKIARGMGLEERVW